MCWSLSFIGKVDHFLWLFSSDWEPSQLFPLEAWITDTLQVQHLKSGFFTRLREWGFDACFWSQKRSAKCRRNRTQWIETQHQKATKASVCIVVLHPTGIESCKFLFLCHYMSILATAGNPDHVIIEGRVAKVGSMELRWNGCCWVLRSIYELSVCKQRNRNTMEYSRNIVEFRRLGEPAKFFVLDKPCWDYFRIGWLTKDATIKKSNRETPTPWLAERCHVMKHFKALFLSEIWHLSPNVPNSQYSFDSFLR